jgi:hypothetical protein
VISSRLPGSSSHRRRREKYLRDREQFLNLDFDRPDRGPLATDFELPFLSLRRVAAFDRRGLETLEGLDVIFELRAPADQLPEQLQRVADFRYFVVESDLLCVPSVFAGAILIFCHRRFLREEGLSISNEADSTFSRFSSQEVKARKFRISRFGWFEVAEVWPVRNANYARARFFSSYFL